MGRKVLQVLDQAYRCTIEEQDDPVVWISHAMKGAGADLALLLRGAAVSYAVQGQDASGLAFGGKAQNQPPRLDEDIAKLAAKGVEVFVVEDDCAERGIEKKDLVPGVKTIARAGIAKLFGGYEQVWHW